MQWKNPFRRDPDAPKEGSSLALRAGGYSLVMTALVLVIAVAVNLIAGMLPSTMTRYDISAAKFYSVTSNTKSVLSGLTDDVTVYWIVQSGAEDRVVENLLANYEALSDHIKVEKRNPDVYPTFAEQYTDETVQNNSLVVECGDRSRYIAYNEIYPTDLDIYSYAYTTSFDGEGALTSAINYVTTEDVPKIYLLEGHGESELPSTFQSQIERENYETAALSLLTVDAIPEDADCILIYGPQSDLADEEVTLLQDYLNAGGKVLVFSGPAVDTPLENLETLRKNGRLSNLKAFVASALKIKPVMGSIPEGTIAQLDQARGINKALVKMVDYVAKGAVDSKNKVLGITHCNCPARAEIVKDAILKRIPVKDVVLLDTAGVSTMYANDGGVIVVI